MFDSMSHPTIDGRWLGESPGMNFGDFADYLANSDVRGACAVALPGIGGYSHQPFFEACESTPSAVPVAALTNRDMSNVPSELELIADLGYRFVKIHPRLLNWVPTADEMAVVFRTATELELAIMYCSYYWEPVGKMTDRDPYWDLVAALNKAPDTRLVVVHGGGVRLLEYAELVRHSERLLLDLSLVCTKYQGSSLDLDLGFLLQSFDQRVCFGTDLPDVSADVAFARIHELTRLLSTEKAQNVLYRNIEGFLGLPTA